MNQDLFEETLRKYVRRKPFFPFLVELLDGKVIIVDRPVVIGGGGATFISEDDNWIEFNCEDVRDIRTMPAESVL
jgi:hypothetical protein